jgi:hypothetical protein
MKKVYYEKVGRRYVPVSEYNSDFSNRLPEGAHLVVVKPGSASYKHSIDPDFAPMIAAGQYAIDAISAALIKAGEIRYSQRENKKPLTKEEKDAWENLINVFGEGARQLEWPSAREVAEAGVNAMINESNRLLKNESVKKAYDHFLLMCKLSQETSNE